MDNLYVNIYEKTSKINLSLESLIVLFVYKQCESSSFKVTLVLSEKPENEPSFYINSTSLSNFATINQSELSKLATYCIPPIAIVNNSTVISGLCSVARQIIKNTPPEHEAHKLLGFREACLMACNESSIWTKFCEIDMISSVKDFLLNTEKYFIDDTVHIPKDLSRFECHMSQPVRIHNVYKVAQDQAKQNNKKSAEINTSIPKEELNLNHIFGEGPFMTLADIILYPCIYIFKKLYSKNIFENTLPLTTKWFENMEMHVHFFDLELLNLNSLSLSDNKVVLQEKIERLSLYLSDPQRYKPKNRIFTKQPDITNALNIIKGFNIQIKTLPRPFGNDLDFDWSKVPLIANPKGGALPLSRMKRKCDQLENLVKAVIKIAKPNQTIIDFCSGSGHLGILLAVKLPDCHIILLENKETSLRRAKDRVKELKLTNVVFLQCNLDYFMADFDIGVSLHACGVATDLVIQHCLKRRASFVSCPCCYGGVHNCHHITYPRSSVFKNSALTLRDYLVLGHSADQTHDAENSKTKQGIECMNIIDTDRKLQAEEFGYEVWLSKMIPDDCTPKNNILVGIPKNSKNY